MTSPRFVSSFHRRVLAVALVSFREAIREKVLYALVAFAMLLIGTALLLGEISVGQERRIALDVGLGAIRLMGTLMAVVLGVRLLEREVERRTISLLLAKPIRREEVVLGKFLGGALLLLSGVILMAGGLLLVLMRVTPTWAAELPRLLPALFLLWLQFLMTAAIAFLFSAFSTSALSAILTLGVVLIGHASREFLLWAEAVRSPLLAFGLRALYYVLPNMQSLNVTAAVVHERKIALGIVGIASAYALLYVIVLLVLAAWIFHRREIR